MNMHTAKYFVQEAMGKVRCLLCPHQCLLSNTQTGICGVRSNQNGVLASDNYGKISAIHIDPVEKKPLYHFFPGKKILSLGSVGCNLRCNFCQNADISQVGVKDFPWLKVYAPEEIVGEAILAPDNIGIAYTYNEPIIFYEFMLDIAKISKSKGLQNVMVSNGYMNTEPLTELLPWIDAFNIDLKAFDETFYKTQTQSQLEPVKNTLQQIRKSGKHLEITNLIIPGLNDDERTFSSMVQWISKFLGRQTVLHLSRYFPNHHAKQPATSEKTLRALKDIAQHYIDYVYLGNIAGNTTTHCHNCNALLVQRFNYETTVIGLDNSGNCKYCGVHVAVM
jgi:pyruvate formate lyase activating enzyme